MWKMSKVRSPYLQPTPQRLGAFLIFLWLGIVSWEIGGAAQEKEAMESSPLVELTFNGIGAQRTDSFTVKDGWEIQWETQSSSFKLSLQGIAQKAYSGLSNEWEALHQQFEFFQPIVLANSTKSTGSTFHPKGGTFYFNILADGPWNITLRTVKRPRDYLDFPYTGAP